MSSFFGKVLTILGLKKREANILVVGLDNSGKSTILNYLKRKEDQCNEIVPTVGYTVERLSGIERNRLGITLTAYDMSGQGRYRNLWEHYYNNVEGIIFVIDSTDELRLVVARDELEMLLKHQQQNDNVNLNGNDNDDGKISNNNHINDDDGNQTISNQNNSTNQSDGNNDNNINGGKKANDIPILFFANKMDLKESLSTMKISQTLGLHRLPHKQWHVQSSNALNGDGIQDGINWLLVQIDSNNKKKDAK